MKKNILPVLILLILNSVIFGQSYTMKIHLSGGQTETIPVNDIAKIVFSDINGIEEAPLPGTFQLMQNYPNPFNPSTTIEYRIPETGNVKITVYDIKGNMIRELLNGTQSSGSHQVSWDGKNSDGKQVSSGIYLYKTEYKNSTVSKSMMLIK